MKDNIFGAGQGVVSGIEGAAGGSQRPDMLKASIGYLDGYIGVGQISYAAPNALACGRLALQILEERFSMMNIEATEKGVEFVGVDPVL